MTQKVKTPYNETPYEVLYDPVLGPLPTDSSRDEVSDRVKKLMKKKGRAAIEARQNLLSSAKRIGWDIFCSPLELEQRALQDLIEQRPSFHHSTPTQADVAFGPEFLVWDEIVPTGDALDIACQELRLKLSTRYDKPKQPFQEVTFDI